MSATDLYLSPHDTQLMSDTVERVMGQPLEWATQVALQETPGQSQEALGLATQANARLDALEPRVTSLEGRTTSLEGRTASLEGRTTTLENRTTALEGRTSALEVRMTTAEANISTNTSNIATNTANISTNTSNITNLQGRVTTLEANTVGTTNFSNAAKDAAGASVVATGNVSALYNGTTHQLALDTVTVPRFLGIRMASRVISANDTVQAGDYQFLSTATLQLNLPPIATVPDREYRIKVLGGTTTLKCNGSETIDGANTKAVAAGTYITFMAISGFWYTVG